MKVLRNRNVAAGNVLVTALIITGVLGISLFGYLSLIQTQQKNNYRSSAWKLALANAEAGLEEALAHLNHSGTNNLDADGWTRVNNNYTNGRSINSGRYAVTIVMTNYLKPAIRSSGYMPLPLSTNNIKRTIYVTTEPVGLFVKTLLAMNIIDMNGNNLRTDSYDSTDPNFSAGGRYDPAKSKDNGDVASTAGIIGIIDIGNADIYGRVATGPGGTVVIGPKGSVGDKSWQDAGNSGIQPGKFADDVQVELEDLEFSLGDSYVFNPAGGVVGEVAYDHILDSGDYKITNLSGSVLVRGDATLLVTDIFSMSSSDIIQIEPDASLKLYLDTDAKISGQGIMNSGSPEYLQVYGLSGCNNLEFSGNASFSGVVYAPNAQLSLKGGGSDVADFQGAAIANNISLFGNYNFHYDESLKDRIIGPIKEYVVTSWSELTTE
ncbi:MAG: hypothetical protein K9N48_07595 [Verrucomicrobia bacterium]|nr:hypothetical protein [Verrucomicrobiota bacterium]MCF7708045.1 hypothetical protein [Verrucomicrobiota bacterium]